MADDLSPDTPTDISDAQLVDLQGVAMMADHGGRRWLPHAPNAKGYPQSIEREGDVVLVATCYEGPQYPPIFVDFITAFDPPTVLSLVNELLRRRWEVQPDA